MQSFKHWLTRLRSRNQRTPRRSASRPIRLNLEALEGRDLCSVSPLPTAPISGVLAPPELPFSNMTQLAQQMQQNGQMPLPSGTTTLYLNFDGWSNCPYNSNQNVNGAALTAMDEQDILYRTTEIFAPFNVRVLPISGNGVYSTDPGSTTIFVNSTTQLNFTPTAFMDYPSTANPNGGTSHILNSDPYDIAFVNPSVGAPATGLQLNFQTAAAIAHEAGHTFGLGHVRTDGQPDYKDGKFTGVTFSADLPPDVMSYDSNDDFFSNTAYDLTVANNTAKGVIDEPSLLPNFQGQAIVQQDSFTYLQTVLGARPSTSHVAVVDENQVVAGHFLNLVDPGYYNNTPSTNAPAIALNSTVSGTLQPGDYAGYLVSVPLSWQAGQTLTVTATAGIDPNFLISDQTSGGNIVVGASDKFVDFQPIAGHTYAIMVSCNPDQPGAYSFTVGAVGASLAGKNFTLTDANHNVTGHLNITSQTGGVISGTFAPNDGSGVTVNVTGHVGALVNGSCAFSFWGARNVTVLTPNPEPGQPGTFKVTAYSVNFTGQVAHKQSMLFRDDILSGNGSYSVSVTTGRYYPRGRTYPGTTRVTEQLSIVSGSDYSSVATLGGTNMATDTSSTPNLAALDLLMASAGVAGKKATGEIAV